VVICLEQGADLHMAQLMPLPLTVSCFSKNQIGFTSLVPAHPGSPGKGPLNARACVCDAKFSSVTSSLQGLQQTDICYRLVCLQSDWLPSAAELSRSPLPTPGTLFLNTSSQLLRCSHLSII